MDYNLCMGCMLEKRGSGPCPYCGFDPATYEVSPHHLRPGTVLHGKYLIGRVLGEGGFGITYIGWDVDLEMKLAMKEYYPNGYVTRSSTYNTSLTVLAGSRAELYQKGLVRFIHEARRLAKFWNLPGVVSVKDYFQENNTAYIVMEFAEGQTLRQILDKNGGRLEAGRVLAMMRPVMESLSKIHASGLIHRDISPDNLMVDEDDQVRLIDFGAARYFITDNKSMSVMLKPGYTPEEQYRTHGKQGPWTDVYSLCATIYCAITGEAPEESLERLEEDTLKPPTALGADLSPRQERALLRGLSVYGRDRYQSVRELMEALYGEEEALPVNNCESSGKRISAGVQPERQEEDSRTGARQTISDENPDDRENTLPETENSSGDMRAECPDEKLTHSGKDKKPAYGDALTWMHSGKTFSPDENRTPRDTGNTRPLSGGPGGTKPPYKKWLLPVAGILLACILMAVGVTQLTKKTEQPSEEAITEVSQAKTPEESAAMLTEEPGTETPVAEAETENLTGESAETEPETLAAEESAEAETESLAGEEFTGTGTENLAAEESTESETAAEAETMAEETAETQTEVPETEILTETPVSWEEYEISLAAEDESKQISEDCFRLFDNGDSLTLTLQAQDLPEGEYTVVWTVGHYNGEEDSFAETTTEGWYSGVPDENGEYDGEIDKTCYTFRPASGELPSITFDGDEIQKQEFATENGCVSVRAAILNAEGEEVLITAPYWIGLAQEDIDQGVFPGSINALPQGLIAGYSELYAGGAQVYSPDYKYDTLALRITDASVESTDGQETPVVSVSRDENEDGSVYWNLYADETGEAQVTFTWQAVEDDGTVYRDGLTTTVSVSVREEIWFVDTIWSDAATEDCLLPGGSLTLMVQGGGLIGQRLEDGFRYDLDAGDVTYEWTADDSGLLTLSPDGDACTVTASEEAEDGTTAQVTLRVYRDDEKQELLCESYVDIWIYWSYYELRTDELPNNNYLEIGESVEVSPVLLRHSREAEEPEDRTEDARFVLGYDTDAFSVLDCQGQEVGNLAEFSAESLPITVTRTGYGDTNVYKLWAYLDGNEEPVVIDGTMLGCTQNTELSYTEEVCFSVEDWTCHSTLYRMRGGTVTFVPDSELLALGAEGYTVQWDVVALEGEDGGEKYLTEGIHYGVSEDGQSLELYGRETFDAALEGGYVHIHAYALVDGVVMEEKFLHLDLADGYGGETASTSYGTYAASLTYGSDTRWHADPILQEWFAVFNDGDLLTLGLQAEDLPAGEYTLTWTVGWTEDGDFVETAEEGFTVGFTDSLESLQENPEGESADSLTWQSDSGEVPFIRLEGEALWEQFGLSYGSVDVQAELRDADGTVVVKVATAVILEHAEAYTNYPETLTAMPGSVGSVFCTLDQNGWLHGSAVSESQENYQYYVRTAGCPYGEWDDLEVTGVTVENTDGGETAAVAVWEQDSDTEQHRWDLAAERTGEADLVISFRSVDSNGQTREDTAVIHLTVQEEIWTTGSLVSDHTGGKLLSGGSLTLAAGELSGQQARINENEGDDWDIWELDADTEGLTLLYRWVTDYAGEELLTLNQDGTACTVTAGEMHGTATVVLQIWKVGDGLSEELLCESEPYKVTICTSYYEIEPANWTESLEFGESAELSPSLLYYSTGAESAEEKDDAEFYIWMDGDNLSVTDCRGEVITSDSSFDVSQLPLTVTRIGSNIDAWLSISSWYDGPQEWNREYRISCSQTFLAYSDGTVYTKASDGTQHCDLLRGGEPVVSLEVGSDLLQLAADGGYTVEWKVGILAENGSDWDRLFTEEENYTVSDDGLSLTLHGESFWWEEFYGYIHLKAYILVDGQEWGQYFLHLNLVEQTQ